jgi:hypothetical protein
MHRFCVHAVCSSLALLTLLASAHADEWFVAPGGSGNGGSADPFGSVQDGLNAAQPGDVVIVREGVYTGTVETRRDGTSNAPITLRAEAGASVVIEGDRRALRVDHARLTVEGIVFDGKYGDRDTVDVNDGADHFVMRDCEVRRSGRDCIDMGSPTGVRIERCLIHHCLQWDSANNRRVDAHGIVGGAMHDLVIRDTEIHTFSGDAVQLDPGRDPPGWDAVLIQGCTFWLEPLPEDTNGYSAGTVPGENAIDTKTWADGPRSTMTITDTTAFGFRDGIISNMAAFNMKNKVDAIFDRVTVYDSEIAFRLRGPGEYGGAHVTVQNAVVYDVDKAVRYEDDIESMEIFNCTFGADIGTFFQEVQADNAGVDVRNLAVLAGSLPSEAAHSSNLAMDATAFVDASRHDYHLLHDAPAVDHGTTIGTVTTDRDGIPRPQGDAYDTGAYEFTQDTPDAGIDAGGDPGGQDAGADPGWEDAGADPGAQDAGADPGMEDAGADPGPEDAGTGDDGSAAGDSDAGSQEQGGKITGSDCACNAAPANQVLLLLLLPFAIRLRPR